MGSVEAVVQVDCLSDVTVHLLSGTVLTDITWLELQCMSVMWTQDFRRDTWP